MVPVVAFIGASGAGKTRLIASLVQLLRVKGYRIGAIKHTHHTLNGIELDKPGKDSHRLREAGADPVLLVGSDGLATRTKLLTEPQLEELVNRYCADCDLVLAEGFSNNPCPKVVVERSGVAEKPSGRAAWAHGEVIALVSDNPTHEADQVRCFSADEPPKLADYLQERFLR